MKNKILNIYSPINWDYNLNASLIGEWSSIPQLMGRGQWINLASSNNYASLTNGAAVSRGGIFFDGVNDLGIADSISSKLQTGPITYIGYFTLFSSTGAGGSLRPAIFECREGPSNNDSALDISTSFVPRMMIYNGGFQATSSSTVLSVGKIYHIAGTHTPNGNVVLYVNGLENSRLATNTTRATTPYSTKATIAGCLGSAPGWLGALIYNISVYNRCLSSPEIYQHYRECINGNTNRYNWRGTTKYYLPPIVPYVPPPTLYFHKNILGKTKPLVIRIK